MSFWANKINGQPAAPQPVANRELYGLYLPVAQPEPTPQVVPQQPQQPSYTPTAATTKGNICGGCGADTILTLPGNQVTSCGTCGWHPRFQHSTYGLNAPTDRSAKATPARQNDSALPLSASIALLNEGGGSHITAL